MPMTPLAVVDAAAAFAVAGTDADAFAVFGSEAAVGSGCTVLIADSGDDLKLSGVRSRDTFALLEPMPGMVATRLWDAHPRPIHLFGRLPEGMIYLGTGRLSRGGPNRESPQEIHECLLRLDSPLDFQVLDRVRPPTPPTHVPGVQWLDLVRSDPTAALRQFVQGWHPRTADHERTAAPPSLAVPAALDELYRLAEGRHHLLGVQNSIHRPADLSLDDQGRLRFGYENQGGFYWALDPAEDDPTVWTVEPPDHAFAEREPLSGFLLQFTLSEAVMSAPYQAWSGHIPTPMAEPLTTILARVPLKTWMWSWYSASFYVAPGLVAEITETEEQSWIRMGATHRSVLRPLADLHIQWSTFDG
ncbi:hypothetical protein [Actinomadura rudentiformis]|uniref:Uncharacterized protein n=1 Tax=Actinomadura rudentiformis TaxID=359158 RepID=A0A6H9YR00_9ACTN|nr:hypothetical protein [Actinomadura rudentiformis]KAB2350334.1 hypothetical protein F8566_11200 [Actinomadura rudentiformis]